MPMCFIMMLYQLFYSYTRLQCKGPCPCVLVRGKRKRKRKGSPRQRNRTGANKNNQKGSNRTPEANEPSATRQSTRPKSLPPATNYQNIATPEMPLPSPDGKQPSSMKASVPIPRSDPGLVQNNQQIVQPRPVIQGGRIGTSYFENIDQLKVVSNKNSQPYIRSNMGPSNEYAPVYLKYKNDTKPFTKSLDVRVISQTSTYKQGKNTGHKSNKQEKVYSESNPISLKSNTRASDSFKHEPKYKTDSGSSLSGNTKAIVSQQDSTGSLKTKHRTNTPIAEVHQRTQLTSSRVFKPKGDTRVSTEQLNNAGTPNKKGMNIPAAQVQQRASSRQFQLTGDIRVKTAQRNNVDTQNTIQKEPHTPAFNDPQGTRFTPGRKFQPIMDTRVETSQQNSAGTQNTIQKGINTKAVDIPPRTLYSSNMNVQQSDSIRVQTSQRNNAGTKNINQKGISPSAFQGQQRTQFTPGRHFKQPRNLHLGITKDIVGQKNVASAQFTNQKRINTPAFEAQQHTEFKSGTNLQPTLDTRVQTSQPNSAGTQNTIQKGINTKAVDIPPRTLYSSNMNVQPSDSIRVQTSQRNNAGTKNINQKGISPSAFQGQQRTQFTPGRHFKQPRNLHLGITKDIVGQKNVASAQFTNQKRINTPAFEVQQHTEFKSGTNLQPTLDTRVQTSQPNSAGTQNTIQKGLNTPAVDIPPRTLYSSDTSVKQSDSIRVQTSRRNNAGIQNTNQRRLNVPPITSQQHTQHKVDRNFQRSGNLQSGSTKAFAGHQISESTENNNWRGMVTSADGTQQPTKYTPGRNVQQSGHSQPGSTKTIAGQRINAGNQNTGRKIINTPDLKTQQRPQFIPGRNIQQSGNARVHTQSGQSINVGLSKTNERDFSQNNPTGGILAVYDLTDFQGGPVDPKPVAEKTKFQGVKSGLTETRQPKIKSKPDLLPSNRQGDKKIWSRSAGSHITDLRKVEHRNQRTNSGTRKPAAQGLPINMNPNKAIPQNADNRKVNHATVGTSNRQNKSVSKYQVDTNLVSSQIPRKTSITKSSGKQRHPKTSNSKSENPNMTTKDDSIPTAKQSSGKSRNIGKPQTLRRKQQQDKPLRRRLTMEHANVNSEQANVINEQASVNSEQANVNNEQANVNGKQANVNSEQANVNSEKVNVNSDKKRRRPQKKKRGCICPGSIKRVCGKDGKTYKNACKLKCS